MPLNPQLLGTALYTASRNFNDKDIAPENLEAARQDFWKGVAEQIILHVKANALVTVTTTGTAAAQAGTGTIM